jgi:hypothetical protein
VRGKWGKRFRSSQRARGWPESKKEGAELQWDAAVPGKHWVAVVGWRRWLSMASRSYGGGPATVVEWRRRRGAKCRHVRE